MTAWNIEELRHCLGRPDLAEAEELIRGWLLAGVDEQAYAEAAGACAAWRRYDLADRIFERAWRSGTRPYDAAYAVEYAWRDAHDGFALADRAERLAVELTNVSFRREGDAFHIGAARTILTNLAALARIEEDEGEPFPETVHSFALEALWRRIWACLNSLQFAKTQRLGRCYLAVSPSDTELLIRVAAYFFAFSGGAEWAIQAVRVVAAGHDLHAEATALRAAAAYEAELHEEFRDAIADLEKVRAAGLPLSAPQRAAVASGLLYAAFDALFRQGSEACLAIAERGAADFAGEPWAPLFQQARGMAIERKDRRMAVECYVQALDATGDVRTPFPHDAAIDAAAAEGRWDAAYAYMERRAAAMRPFYTKLIPDGAALDTSRPDSFPTRGTLLSGWGVGDDVIAYGLLRRHFPASECVVVLDERLLAMARRAYPQGRFLGQATIPRIGAAEFWASRRGVPEDVDFLRCSHAAARSVQETGHVILQEDLSAIHAARKGMCPSAASMPVLAPEPSRIQAMRGWVARVREGRPCFAIGWRSGLRSRTRARTFLDEAQVARLMRAVPAAWILMQYDWDAEEVARIEAMAGTRFLICPDLDLKQDLEGVAALSLACDALFCNGSATRDVAAAAGAIVVSLHHGRTNAEAWRQDSDRRDVIFPSMLHVDPASGGDGVVEQAILIARSKAAVYRQDDSGKAQ